MGAFVVVAALILAFCVSALSAYRNKASFSTHNIFPGPKGLPWIGNLLTTPVNGAVFHFKLLTDKYGPIAETTLLGQRFLLVSSTKVANELLVGSGRTCSGRPKTAAVHDAQSKFGVAEYLPLMSFNEDHHRHKRVGKVYLGHVKGDDHMGYPALEARRLMRNLARKGTAPQKEWIRMTEDLTSRTISRIVFGSPEYAEKLHGLTWQLLIWVSPNGALPNLMNFLEHLPAWISPWKFLEDRRHTLQQGWFLEIMAEIEEKIAEGTAPPSLMRDYLSGVHGQSTYATRTDASKALGMIATAAIFTISGPLQNIVRALACFPEWQPRLQAEMDAVVPFPRTPSISDLPKLPLFRAFLRETTRWRAAIPSGIPHEVEEDTAYRGTVIPKNTAIFPLEYGMNRDPEVFDRPYDFDPMRWLDPASPNYQEPLSVYPSLAQTPMFGWGRRYCLGHELAMDEVYIFGLYLVWSFNIKLTDQAAVERNLLPGEKRGGMQWPDSWDQALIIMRPTKIRLEFFVRTGREAEIESLCLQDVATETLAKGAC